MPDLNPIIVLQYFNNPIEANIIKAKLDAYGIPCFLSEENFTLLTTSLLSGGVRLHIFEQDRDQATQLLAEENLQKIDSEDDLLSCPQCHSKKIISITNDQFNPALIVKLVLQLTKPHYCLNCETQFD